MFPDIADEIDEGVVFHPVVVVHQFGLVGGVGVKVQEAGELGLEAFNVMVEGGLVQEVALGALHRRVADHSGGASHEGEGLVPAILEMLEYHYTHKVTDMQRVGRGIDSHICRLRAFHELFFRPGHDVLDHASPL